VDAEDNQVRRTQPPDAEVGCAAPERVVRHEHTLRPTGLKHGSIDRARDQILGDRQLRNRSLDGCRIGIPACEPVLDRLPPHLGRNDEAQPNPAQQLTRPPASPRRAVGLDLAMRGLPAASTGLASRPCHQVIDPDDPGKMALGGRAGSPAIVVP
jgi:hypothetical protein